MLNYILHINIYFRAAGPTQLFSEYYHANQGGREGEDMSRWNGNWDTLLGNDLRA